MNDGTAFKPLRIVATRLGLPIAWLRSEVEAGRVPSIKAGNKVLLHQQTVEHVLIHQEKDQQAEKTVVAGA